MYVWTSASPGRWTGRTAARPTPQSAVFRIPLDGDAPTALKTAGVPVDQMSFLEDTSGHLNVLLREDGRGEGMWGSEHTRGAMALLRVPLAAFGDGRGAAQREHYRTLAAAAGWSVQNRYVGDWLLWGGADAGGRGTTAWALRYADARKGQFRPVPIPRLVHSTARNEPFLLLKQLAHRLVEVDPLDCVGQERRHAQHLDVRQLLASQGESRTHGFFYRPTGADEGLLGLPVLESGTARRKGVYHDAQGAASVTLLRVRDLGFLPLGELRAQPQSQRDDACKASCVDWYGNARPIFLGDRVLALMGYELVEGRLAGDRWSERIDERRRISFAPFASSWREGRYSPFN